MQVLVLLPAAHERVMQSQHAHLKNKHLAPEMRIPGREACCPFCCPFAACTAASRRRAGIPSEAEGLKDLQQGEVLAVSEDDHFPRLLAQLALDEAQQVLLVHARTVMHMRIHLHARKSQLL